MSEAAAARFRVVLLVQGGLTEAEVRWDTGAEAGELRTSDRVTVMSRLGTVVTRIPFFKTLLLYYNWLLDC